MAAGFNTLVTAQRVGVLRPPHDKVRRPVNKKIMPEKLIEYVKEHPDSYLKEIAKVFGCCPAAVLRRLRKLGITRKKEHILQRVRPAKRRTIFRTYERHSEGKTGIY